MYYVSPSGSDSYNGLYPAAQSGSNGPFQTLARAMSVATSGDTVELRAGTYAESVSGSGIGTSSNPVTIENYNGEKVVFTRGPHNFAFYFDNCALTIEGLSFTTGGVDLLNPVNCQILNSSFAGITDNNPLYISNGSGVSLQNDTFTNNAYANTIYITGPSTGTVSITGSTFQNNTPSQASSTLIYVDNGSDAAIQNNTFKDNGYTNTVGITGQNTGTVAVKGNTFQDNIDSFSESSSVVMVFSAAGTITISDNKIFNTLSPSQLTVKPQGTSTAAVMISQSSGVTVDGNTIKDFRFQGTVDDTADNSSYLKTPAQGGERNWDRRGWINAHRPAGNDYQ